ncbi:MAG TPA: hypothetical protein VK524_32935 [Polyangiaceae bacterium]|nr:hypothetical protein [Polyangiaceae bacterium]
MTVPSLVNAQACHSPSASEATSRGLRVGINAEAAGFHTRNYEGHYEGLRVSAQWSVPWASVYAALPGYRLLRNQAEFRGLGDVLVGTRVVALRMRADTARLGVAFAATAPTGNAEHELGMGHFMLMPGLFANRTLGRLMVAGETHYSRALVSKDSHEASMSEHHHHHRAHAAGPRPLVDPMNRSEVSGALSASLALLPAFRMRAGVYGALPIADEDGASRAAARIGVGWTLPHLETMLEIHRAFVGDPFTQKLVLEIAVRP